MRYMSWSNVTTGTGASGEMRVTRPTMNLSIIASPMTRTLTPLTREMISRARSGASGGSSIVATRCGEGKSDEHEEEHQELGVAKVVLEKTGREHAGDGREAGRGKRLIALRSKNSKQAVGENRDEGDPDGEGGQSALGGDLQRDVVQVRIHCLHRIGISILRVE